MNTKYYFIIALSLVAVSSYYLGQHSVKSELNINDNVSIQYIEKEEILDRGDRIYYASGKGKKYYPWYCLSTIKEENKVWFKTEENAQNQGYSRIKNC